MTPQKEQQLLQSLYDRLFDAITYAPGGGRVPIFDKATTFLQFSKNTALNPADFNNMMSSINPNGDQKAALAFSQMVDVIPELTGDYAPSTKTVAKTYQQIVNGANTRNTTAPAQQATYDKAQAFLTATTSIPNFSGPPTVTTGPSPIAQTYDNNQSAYVTALGGYRLAQNGYNLDNVADQRAWQAVAPGLQLNLDSAWNNWVRGGKQNVELAQNALVSTINNIISAVIAASQNDMSPQHWLSGLTAADGPWMPAYALPSDWAGAGSGATTFTLKSSEVYTQADSSFSSYSAGASWGGGLWSVGGSVSGSSGSSSYHMDANNVTISAKLQLVRIMRPWLNTLLFNMKGWWLSGQPVNAISNGALKGNENSMLPIIPTAFVAMSDVSISADFSTEDKTHVESAISGSTSVGWGPFSVGGSYSHSESHDTFKATFDGGTIRIPGIQVAAWVNAITAACAPMTAPKAAHA